MDRTTVSTVRLPSFTAYGKYANSTGAEIVPRYSSSPISSRSKVVFPLPFRPIRPSRQSVSSWRLTCSKIVSKLPSYPKVRSETEIKDIVVFPPDIKIGCRKCIPAAYGKPDQRRMAAWFPKSLKKCHFPARAPQKRTAPAAHFKAPIKFSKKNDAFFHSFRVY